MDTTFQTAAWYRALSLTERLTSGTAAEISPNTIDNDLADRSPTPTWLDTLARSFAAAPTCEVTFPHGDEALGFLEAVRLLVEDGQRRLTREAHQLGSNTPFDPNTVASILMANLPWRLTQMLSRTMILELNVARLRGLLEGDTAAARFASFIGLLRQPEVPLTLLSEYPVLARQLATCVEHWVQFGLEFLGHLCTDWDAIKDAFTPNCDPGPLSHIDEAGDSHRGGKSVLIATFASGFRVVYKPKPLAIDAHFQELLRWLNEHGQEPNFRTMQILDRENYGWVEFVESQPCTSETEVRRFYQRQGGQLALLYALEATDLHSENLIAAGEHPVLVDLETLFHPPTPGETANNFLEQSVLRVGLLPERFYFGGSTEGIDISGLGAESEQRTPFGVPRWEGAGTDNMRVVYKQVTLPGTPNRPTVNGKSVEVSAYGNEVADGFVRVYRLLMQHRDKLLRDGPVARCDGDTVRVILRPTTTYCILLRESFHPDMLRDALDRDRLFDRLWVRTQTTPCLSRVISAEREDLWRGDVPVFTTRPESRDLFTSTGERIADFFDEPGMSLVRRRILSLSDEDLTRQEWIIKASLATIATNNTKPRQTLVSVDRAADRADFLAAARVVGERLESLALRDTTGVTWIGLTAIDERRCALNLLGPDLYDGQPGVVLFLAHLGAITGEGRWTDLARTALAKMLRLGNGGEDIGSVGAFSGWGGVIYTLTHLGALWADSSLIAEAHATVSVLASLIEHDDQFDIITGTAGCIGSLAALHRCTPSKETLVAAKLCGDWLLEHAVPAGAGISWPAVLPAHGPLTGFSHGTAGVAWALQELAALSGERRFAGAARAAIAYERGLFSRHDKNWPDLREAVETSASRFATAWCHGAPGIGLARLSSLRHVNDHATRTEIASAIQATLAHGFGKNHSLCHGDLGNLELLIQAVRYLGGEDYRADLGRLAAQILADIRTHGYRCGVPQGVESPGLMTGIAGIGYGLLRLADPTRIPSLLTLEPPS